jgi:hypothetical protein
MKVMKYIIVVSAVALLATGGVFLMNAEAQMVPFGDKESVTFAEHLWDAMKGYDEWRMKSDFYPGKSPHGAVLRLYYNVVNVDGKPYHLIIKDNYGGQNATVDRVAANPDGYLAAVTVMLQREQGYDPDNNDWFWAKYKPDGSLDKNPKGMALAGRVAKGMDTGCIACHKGASGGDYLFTND